MAVPIAVGSVHRRCSCGKEKGGGHRDREEVTGCWQPVCVVPRCPAVLERQSCKRWSSVSSLLVSIEERRNEQGFPYYGFALTVILIFPHRKGEDARFVVLCWASRGYPLAFCFWLYIATSAR